MGSLLLHYHDPAAIGGRMIANTEIGHSASADADHCATH